MKKLLIAGLCLFTAFTSFGQLTNATVGLGWTPTCQTEVEKYRVYYTTNLLLIPRTNVVPPHVDSCGTNHPVAVTNVYFGDYSKAVGYVDAFGYTNSTCTVSNLVRASTYYFVLTSMATNGLESDYSNEVSYKVPAYPTNTPPSKVEGFRIIQIN